MDDPSQLDHLLEEVVFASVKALSFLHEVKVGKWKLFGLGFQHLTKLYF